MLQFPRWKVDVTVGGDLVKTFRETATTSAAAIAKAKHKMRGAVSSAGAFKFKATREEEPARHHATKKKPPKPPAQYHVWVSGPVQGETTLYRGKDRRAAEAAFDERVYRNNEGMGDDDEDVVIESGDRELRRFGPATFRPTYFGGSPPRSRSSHHATKKKSPAQLDREIAQALTSRSGLSKHQLDLLSRRKPGGGLRAGYLTPTGWHGDPMVIEDRKLRLEALREQPAPRFPKEPGRRSHSTKKSAAPKASEYTKLATATSVPRIEKYVNEYAYSTNYRVDPETLQITNPVKAPPENWFVMRYRGGYLFGRKV